MAGACGREGETLLSGCLKISQFPETPVEELSPPVASLGAQIVHKLMLTSGIQLFDLTGKGHFGSYWDFGKDGGKEKSPRRGEDPGGGLILLLLLPILPHAS